MLKRFSLLVLLWVTALWIVNPYTAVSQQYIGGALWENTTYSPNLNPYIVTEPVIVPQGVQLTIEPGTKLLFMIGSSLLIEGGILHAEGTASQPIQLTALNTQGDENRWNGVQFVNAHSVWDEQGNYLSGNILRYVTLSKATTGLLISDTASIYIKDIQLLNNSYGLFIQSEGSIHFQHSTIYECSYGLYLRNSSNNLIQECNISHCDIGIFFPSNSNSRFNRILNNNISYNRNIALFLSLGQNSLQYNYIGNNTVTHNNIGLHIGNGGTADRGYNTLENNIVRYNDIGIKLSQDADTLRGNELKYNGIGLLLSRATDNLISGNSIGNSATWGIKIIDGSSSNLLVYNNIHGNAAGLCVLSSDERQSELNKVQYNAFEDNHTEAISVHSGPQREITYNTIQSRRDTGVFVNRYEKDVVAYNNYWYTQDTLRVDSLIFDFYDENIYGKVLYRPLLSAPHPEAPISAPKFVIKRQAGDSLLLTWKPNLESDLAGYKIYYGNGPHSGFGQQIDVGMITRFVLHGIMLSDTVAITAYDTDADDQADQREGHESAYSLAIAGPYAGEDDEICEDQFYYTLEATGLPDVPLNWYTDGDGSFAVSNQLITWYVPGPGDIEAGEVRLYINQINENISLSDTLLLLIAGQPQLFAGNDTTINQYESYNTQSASASDYTNLVWTTSGDGHFEDSIQLHTLYIPGEADIAAGQVLLTLALSSKCNNLSGTVTLSIVPAFSLSGRVHYDNGTVAGIPVLALNSNIEASRAVSLTNADISGEFYFSGLPEGNYYIYAVPNPAEAAVFPTYYAEGVFWQDAYAVPCNADVYDIDIILKPESVNLPTGEAKIEGTFIYERSPKASDTIYNSPWFASRMDNFSTITASNAAANHTVLLMNPSLTHVLAWSLSAPDGSFSFAQLPYGNYRLLGEKAGHSRSVSPLITLSPAHPNAENISLSVQEKSIDIEVPDAGDQIQLLTVYPNPAKDRLWIMLPVTGNDCDAEVNIYSAAGKLVQTQAIRFSGPGSPVEINLNKLESGLYSGLLRCLSGETYRFRLLLNR